MKGGAWIRTVRKYKIFLTDSSNDKIVNLRAIYMKKIKRTAERTFAIVLAAGLTFQAPMSSMAGLWQKDTIGWTYTEDNGVKASGKLITDQGELYLIGEDGYMKTGWQLLNGKWFFFNVSGNTVAPEGAALKGWQWIDGKCYYFEMTGTETRPVSSMYENEKTPDGYDVNKDGAWTVNGNPVTEARGITTKIPATAGSSTTGRISGGSGGGGGSSHGSSGGGSSSGSSSGGSSNTEKPSSPNTDTKKDEKEDEKKTGSYTIWHIDENGHVLKEETKTALIGSKISLKREDISGYEYLSGETETTLTEDGVNYTITYKKEKGADESEGKLRYRYVYIDKDTDKTIGTSDWKDGKKGDTVNWAKEEVKNYTLSSGNNLTNTVTENNSKFTIYFKKDNSVSYTFTWKDEKGRTIRTITGTGNVEDVISVPALESDDYTDENDTSEITLKDEDNKYEFRCTRNEVASDSDLPEEVNYSISYKDFDTGKIVKKEEGKIGKGSELIPECPEGYHLADEDDVLKMDKKTNKFTVDVLKDEQDDVSIVSYTAACEKEDGTSLESFNGTASIAGNSDIVTILHPITGYEQNETDYELSKDDENALTIYYSENGEDDQKHMTFTVRFVDIDTMDTVKTDTISTKVGEHLDFTDYEVPDGYEKAGIFPDDIRVSGEESNNAVKLYVRKIKEIEETKKYANWTVKYVNYDDPSEDVLPSQTGRSEIGKFPVYFNKEYKIGKKLWRAVDSSPRTFTLKDNTDMNVFEVRFKLVSEDEEKDTTRNYALRYVASDTGSVLGVAVGEGKIGDKITLRNSWTEYMFDSKNMYTVKDSGNEEDIIMNRNTVGKPDKNEHTDDYDGYEFIALFTDQDGNAVFDPVRGKVRSGDTFYIDYPDTVERDGVVYRANKKSPYKTFQGGTSYRQIEISYTRGDTSENKLSSWLKTAQDAKNDFYGTTPYRYAVNLKESSSWNDIGLIVGMAPKGSTVNINSVDVPGWKRKSNEETSFVISKDNTVVKTEYDKTSDTPSTHDYKQEYTISFKDEDGNDLFMPYTGTAAFARKNQTIDFYVYFPRTFTDADGNRWRTDAKSPQDFVLRCNSDTDDNKKEVRYYKVYDNEKTEFFVTNDEEVRNYISDIGSYVYDADLHDFYLIGKNYDPMTAVVSEVIYNFNLTDYQGEIADTFDLDGTTYKVYHFRLRRTFDKETCEHEWEYIEELPGNCYIAEETTVQCRKCKTTKTVYKGALGHIDYDHDRVCDVCNQQLKIDIGDSITVTWNGEKAYEGKTAEIEFTCIGTDESGNRILMAEENITKDIYGTYAKNGHGYFSTSDLHAFLNDGFADGLSVKRNLVNKNGDLVTILSKEEYEKYKKDSDESYIFPDGTFLLKSEKEDKILTTKGEDDVENADNYGVRPIIVLPASDIGTGAQGGAWSVNDLQARKIGNKIWLFRCVDENYEDKSETPKHLALFLCDTVIPSNYEMGFGIGKDEDTEGQQETRFFGNSNNYKYSTIASFLKENTRDTGDLVRVNVGVENEYSGETKKGAWNRLLTSDLVAHKRTVSQVYYSDIFIPSVEEAIAMKDYLFKFNGSDKNNAGEIVNNYRRGYFLRTPEYGTTDKVYYVDLVTGRISTTNAVAKSADDVCEVGIRPAYVVEQYE